MKKTTTIGEILMVYYNRLKESYPIKNLKNTEFIQLKMSCSKNKLKNLN